MRKNLAIFLRFLEEKCRIKNPYYITDKALNGKIQFRSFNGNERMRIFSELYDSKFDKKTKKVISPPLFMNNLYPKDIDPPFDFQKEDSAWLGFYELYKTFKAYDKNISTIITIKKSIKAWIEDYLFINKKENYSEKLSPYIHCLVFHYSEMLAMHGNIHCFSTQPNEKLNDFCTQYYHKSTNKHYFDKEYLLQLIKKRNRIEFYNLKGDVEEFHDFNEEIKSENICDDDENVDDLDDD